MRLLESFIEVVNGSAIIMPSSNKDSNVEMSDKGTLHQGDVQVLHDNGDNSLEDEEPYKTPKALQRNYTAWPAPVTLEEVSDLTKQ